MSETSEDYNTIKSNQGLIIFDMLVSRQLLSHKCTEVSFIDFAILIRSFMCFLALSISGFCVNVFYEGERKEISILRRGSYCFPLYPSVSHRNVLKGNLGHAKEDRLCADFMSYHESPFFKPVLDNNSCHSFLRKPWNSGLSAHFRKEIQPYILSKYFFGSITFSFFAI